MPISTHLKSRSGCRICKRRKVKCGEELPKCQNCTNRGLDCSYAPAWRFKEVTRRPRGTSAQTQLSPSYFAPETLLSFFPAESRIRPGATGENRSLELRFIHFFTVSTSHTWSPSQELWVAAAPRASFVHGFLLDAIIALASLHWSTSYKHDESWARTASAAYFDRAIAAYTEALKSREQPGYALPLVLTSALISFYSLVQMGKLAAEKDEVNPVVLFQWIRLARGSNLVWSAGNNDDSLTNSKVMKQLFRRFPEFNSDALAFAACGGQEFDFLRDWSMEAEPLSESDQCVYENTICYTSLTHQTMARNESAITLTRRVVSMIPRCRHRFAELLEQRRPRALAILAHAFAAMKPIENDLWWLKGVPKSIISATREIVSPEWQRLMPKP